MNKLLILLFLTLNLSSSAMNEISFEYDGVKRSYLIYVPDNISLDNENDLIINDYEITSLKQNDVFNEGIIKRIFLTKEGEMNLITNSIMTKNFLVLSIKTDYEELKKNSEKYERYEATARLDLINKIYRIYDDKLNERYKVELNTRTIDRIKNSF